MPGKTIGTQMLAGFPGTYARNSDCVIANRLVKATDSAGPDFGKPVILNSDNTFSKGGATLTMVNFAGVAVREVKSFTTYVDSPTVGNYAPGQACDVIERGSVSVVCQLGTPVAGGKVYVRVTANESYPNAEVGGWEYGTDTDSAKRIEITNAKWTTGLIDANGVAEITILSRNLP